MASSPAVAATMASSLAVLIERISAFVGKVGYLWSPVKSPPLLARKDITQVGLPFYKTMIKNTIPAATLFENITPCGCLADVHPKIDRFARKCTIVFLRTFVLVKCITKSIPTYVSAGGWIYVRFTCSTSVILLLLETTIVSKGSSSPSLHSSPYSPSPPYSLSAHSTMLSITRKLGMVI
jgi:hypothetical protein